MVLGVIGVGKMGGSFVERLVDLEDVERIFLFDKCREKMEKFDKVGKISICSNLKELFENSEIVILAVKPQDFEEVVKDSRELNKDGKILISTMAGVKIERIREELGMEKIVRIMPNLAVKYGSSVVGYSLSGVDENERKTVEKILMRFGEIIEIDEKMFSAFTSIVGSGPAILFVFLESIVDSALRMGFDYKTSRKMAIGMMEGSIEVAKRTNLHTGELKNMVTSPAGTTIEGIYELEKNGFRGIVMGIFASIKRRADELG